MGQKQQAQDTSPGRDHPGCPDGRRRCFSCTSLKMFSFFNHSQHIYFLLSCISCYHFIDAIFQFTNTYHDPRLAHFSLRAIRYIPPHLRHVRRLLLHSLRLLCFRRIVCLQTCTLDRYLHHELRREIHFQTLTLHRFFPRSGPYLYIPTTNSSSDLKYANDQFTYQRLKLS